MRVDEVVAEMDAVVGREVRRQRKQLGWSQQALARKMTEQGVPWHQTAVAKTELGDRPLRLHEAHALAAVLALGGLGGLFGDKDDEYKRSIAQAALDWAMADRAKLMADARHVLGPAEFKKFQQHVAESLSDGVDGLERIAHDSKEDDQS